MWSCLVIKTRSPTIVWLMPDQLDWVCWPFSQLIQSIHDPEGSAKALSIELSLLLNSFRLTVSKLSCPEVITKRVLVSDVAKTFDIFGWFAPAIVRVKILLQRLWESAVVWNEPVPLLIEETWKR